MKTKNNYFFVNLIFVRIQKSLNKRNEYHLRKEDIDKYIIY